MDQTKRKLSKKESASDAGRSEKKTINENEIKMEWDNVKDILQLHRRSGGTGYQFVSYNGDDIAKPYFARIPTDKLIEDYEGLLRPSFTNAEVAAKWVALTLYKYGRNKTKKTDNRASEEASARNARRARAQTEATAAAVARANEEAKARNSMRAMAVVVEEDEDAKWREVTAAVEAAAMAEKMAKERAKEREKERVLEAVVRVAGEAEVEKMRAAAEERQRAEAVNEYMNNMSYEDLDALENELIKEFTNREKRQKTATGGLKRKKKSKKIKSYKKKRKTLKKTNKKKQTKKR